MLKPAKLDNQIGERLVPDGSGGLLSALYQYRRLLTEGAKGFESNFAYAGIEPAYPLKADGTLPEDLFKARVMCEVIRSRHAAVECKWFFDQKNANLIYAEAFTVENEDPCEVHFNEYQAVDGRQLPHRIDVRYGDKKYGYLAMKNWNLGK